MLPPIWTWNDCVAPLKPVSIDLLLLVAALERVRDPGSGVVLAADDRHRVGAVVVERVRVAVGVVADERDRLDLRDALEGGLDAGGRVVRPVRDRAEFVAVVAERERVGAVEVDAARRSAPR